MSLLHDAGLANFYLHDVWALNVHLEAMSQRGMPVDAGRRLEAAQQLEAERQQVLSEIQLHIPDACRPRKIYKRLPKAVPAEQLRCESATVTIAICASCGARRPTRKHVCFKGLLDGGNGMMRQEEVQTKWVRLLPFVISPKGLLAYCKHQGYPLPKVKNKGTGLTRDTTDEGALLRLTLKHEADPVLPLVLRYRDLQKQLGTYVGYPE